MKAEMFNRAWWICFSSTNPLKEMLLELAKASGFGVLSYCENYFKPQGYSLCILLEESHLALHTFPEHGVSYLELSSCVEKPFLKFCKLTRIAATKYGKKIEIHAPSKGGPGEKTRAAIRGQR
ncbi:MAG: S-adenosylmethionine decarboxylase [Candidatus Auribacterota bacterium]|nr:S-adenosylmethionine decarboxylase [Candidatus Auribacterota bacterium]